jgi:hypothetical protein
LDYGTVPTVWYFFVFRQVNGNKNATRLCQGTFFHFLQYMRNI